ncbi:NAD-dependent epimerase/dehydratase family protein [Rhodobacteraceae bacterium NNCM2]|nr:NAD-dependent epimerase/dehydratase family protein [Coraliihabitans acroporae]
MHILLLGATGLIGGAVARCASTAGHSLTMVVRDPLRAPDLPAAEIVTGTLAGSPDWVHHAARADAVIHAACDWSGGMAESEPLLIEGIARSGFAGRIAYTGGVWGYCPGEVTEESAPFDMPSFQWMTDAWAQILRLGMDAVQVHPGLVWADDIPHHEPMHRAALAGEAIPLLAPGDQIQPLVHADDLADGYLRALSHGRHGRDYLFVAENTPARRIAEAVAARHGLETRLQQPEPGDPYAWSQSASSARALAELGWRPQYTDAAARLSNGAIG